MRAVFITIIPLLFLACQEQPCRETGLQPDRPADIEVIRTEKAFFQAASVEEVLALVRKYPDFSRLFLHSGQYANDTVFAEKLYELIRNPYIDTLYREATATFSDLSAIEKKLEGVVARLQSVYHQTPTPTLMTGISGLYNDLYISDSLIVVGIDFFIGEGATYRPINVPRYMLRRYDKAHLVPIITKFMAGAYTATGKGNTLLSEMIDFGKTYYLTSRLLPCTPDSLIIGYTPQEMTDVYENQTIIWANFVENKILYETDHFIKQKFLSERPNVYEISRKCPGRIGAWVGWQIVESYMANNDVKLKDLLAETDNEKIFRQSGYKPRNR